jgi:hypothetical protein
VQILSLFNLKFFKRIAAKTAQCRSAATARGGMRPAMPLTDLDGAKFDFARSFSAASSGAA